MQNAKCKMQNWRGLCFFVLFCGVYIKKAKETVKFSQMAFCRERAVLGCQEVKTENFSFWAKIGFPHQKKWRMWKSPFFHRQKPLIYPSLSQTGRTDIRISTKAVVENSHSTILVIFHKKRRILQKQALRQRGRRFFKNS